MIKRIISISLFGFLILSCKEDKSNPKITYTDIEKKCNKDSLIIWSSEIIKERKKDFVLSSNIDVEISSENSFISVIWSYDIMSSKSLEDKYVEYCIDLINEKIEFPKDFNLKFSYVLSASCPITSNLSIDVNSEIRNLSLIDNISFTQYDFDIIRGRLDSSIKYLKDNSEKVIDTIYLTY